MTTLTRWVLWLMWLAVAGWFWNVGALGLVGALLAGAAGLLVFVWPASSHRRRSSSLQYVEMSKEPIGLS